MILKRPYLTALIGGALVSFVPAILMNIIVQYFPSTRPEDLAAVSDFFSSGIGPLQLLFFAIIVLVVPPIEELIFRGGLWKLAEWKLSPYWTWILISLVFAGIHMEPLHVIGLLPFSFFVGWLRLKTGELGPSIVAHMANNLVGCLMMSL